MGTTSNAIFNGNSRYSKDFQAVIDRTTAIASLPLSQLNKQKDALKDQSTALGGLDAKFIALQSALDRINQAVGGGAYQAAVSDPAKLSATLGAGASEGNYSVEVVDAGAFASSMTSSSWVNSPGAPHDYKLAIGGTEYSIAAADNSAAGVATAINQQYGDRVRAIVVNVGSGQAPDYRISLQATRLGDLAPDLLDGAASLQTQQTVGAEAKYIVNGSGTTVTSASRSVTIATGVTINLMEASATPINITVTRSTSALSDALAAFATAYNAAVDTVDAQRGISSGALAGQSVVSGLSQILSRISTFSAGGSQIGGIGGIGLDLDKTGHLTFNSFQLLAADLTNSNGVVAFLGGASRGGFLKAAADAMNAVESVGTGLLPAAQSAVKQQMSNLDRTIATQQAMIDRMTTRLQEQMAAADALIATMEQRYSYLSGLFAAQYTASKQYG